MRTFRHLAWLGALGLLVACSGGATSSAATTTTEAVVTVPPARPFDFEQWEEVFVDRSRPTEEGSETPALPERSLETAVYLPDTGEPAPLIVFGHGSNGHPTKFTGLLSAWAKAGYVVAAPAFPTTNNRVRGAGQNFGLAAGQPGDVSFVIDEMVRLSSDPGSRLHQRIDGDRIGVGGLSLGGVTTYNVTFSSCCLDERVASAAVFGATLMPLAGDLDLDGHVPLLIVHGDEDRTLDISLAEAAFGAAAPPTWFITLLGAGHSPPFEDTGSPHDDLVEELTVAWWDATLAGDPAAIRHLEALADADPLSTVQART